jgi:hypothetical protein
MPNLKRCLPFFLLAALSLSTAGASTIDFTIDDPNQSGLPGQTLHFFGIITNTGAVDVFINTININFNGPGLPSFDLIDVFPFPILGPGEDTGSIELFQIGIGDPFPSQFTTYTGAITLLGGIDEFAQDILTDPSVAFSLTARNPDVVIPEPATLGLCALSLGLLAASRRLRPRSR